MQKVRKVCLAMVVPLLCSSCTATPKESKSPVATSSFAQASSSSYSKVASSSSLPKERKTDFTMNGLSATGIAPIAEVPSIDPSTLSVEDTSQVTYQADADTIMMGDLYQRGVEITTPEGREMEFSFNQVLVYGNGVDGRCIYNLNKDVTVNIYLLEGSTNYIYTNAPDANAIQIKGNLNIYGKGTLYVVSASKTAITVSGALTFNESTVVISSGACGIEASNVYAKDAEIIVSSAGKDGIRAEMDDLVVEDIEHKKQPSFPEDDGFVKFENSDYRCLTYGDGIQASTYIDIRSSFLDIKTAGSWVSYSNENIALYDLKNEDFKWAASGDSFKRVSNEEVGGDYSSFYALTQSAKGLKVTGLSYSYKDDGKNKFELSSTSYKVNISDSSSVNLLTSDTAVKVDYGDVAIGSGSNLNIKTGNKALSSGHGFSISGKGSNLNVTDSYVGLESSTLSFQGGKTTVSSLGDAIKAEGENALIQTDDGELSLFSTYGGVVSNGDIKLNGGTLLLSGHMGLKSLGDGKVYFNGADVISLSTLANETYSQDSEAYAIIMASNINPDDGLKLIDKDGKTLFSTVSKASAQTLIFSSYAIKAGEYELKVGENERSVTLSSKLTFVGSF